MMHGREVVGPHRISDPVVQICLTPKNAGFYRRVPSIHCNLHTLTKRAARVRKVHLAAMLASRSLNLRMIDLFEPRLPDEKLHKSLHYVH